MAAADNSRVAMGSDGPATDAQAVTPSDTADLNAVSRALWVGSAGDVTVTLWGGQKVTFSGLTVGWHPLRVSRVWATGTAAGEIVAVW